MGIFQNYFIISSCWVGLTYSLSISLIFSTDELFLATFGILLILSLELVKDETTNLYLIIICDNELLGMAALTGGKLSIKNET